MTFRFSADAVYDALAYLQQKGWAVGFDYRDVWREEHQVAWTVAKAMELDVLMAIRQATEQALANGDTLHTFREQLTPTLQRLSWWGRAVRRDPLSGDEVNVQLGSPARLRTIYRTNLRTARAAGQSDRIERTQTTHPYLLYRLGPSQVHRPEHVSWDGLVLPATDRWWQTHFPPNGWGCKCRVRQLNPREAQARGIGKAPPLRRVRWVNERTGQVEHVPYGIDPGWDLHPGVGRLSRAQQRYREQHREAQAVMAQAISLPERPKELFDADVT